MKLRFLHSPQQCSSSIDELDRRYHYLSLKNIITLRLSIHRDERTRINLCLIEKISPRSISVQSIQNSGTKKCRQRQYLYNFRRAKNNILNELSPHSWKSPSVTTNIISDWVTYYIKLLVTSKLNHVYLVFRKLFVMERTKPRKYNK